MHADLVEIAQCKFRCWKRRSRSPFSVCVRQLFVLGKDALRAYQEPLAESHVGIRFALLRGQSVIVHRKGRVELASKRTKLVQRTHLRLCFRKLHVCCFFDVELRQLFIVLQITLWHVDLRKLSSEQHAVHVGALSGVLIGCLSRSSDQINALGEVLRLAMLPSKCHHAQSVARSSISSIHPSVVVS